MVVERDTRFNHYQVVDTHYSGRPARVLYSGNSDAAQSGIALDGGPDLLFDYNQRFRELVRGLDPKRILVLGGGAFTLPMALMQEFPALQLDIVELDGELLDIAHEYFGFQPNEHTTVHVGDACRFLEEATQEYEVIIMDVFDDATIPSAFQTFSVASSMHKRLTWQGVAAINIISSLRGRQSAVLRRMQSTMQTHFLNVQIFPAGSGILSWFPQNYVMTVQNVARDLSAYLRYPAIRLQSI